MKDPPTITLSEIMAGQTVELVCILPNARSAQRLAELGLTPRIWITVLQSAPGQPMLIRVRGSRLAIDRSTASQLHVRLVGRHRRRISHGRWFRGSRGRRRGRGRTRIHLRDEEFQKTSRGSRGRGRGGAMGDRRRRRFFDLLRDLWEDLSSD
ncbi:MAG: ferrous iron transport protein A [Anaerolineales bacterium]|nr:MAG: ferrous iron transport protein A [Anaerolineales bacterium]